MKTIIYFIRHGDVHNPEGFLYGRLPNFGLSDKGRKQIEKTAQYIKNYRIDGIYSSPLARTHESAAITQKVIGLPDLHTSDLLTEVRTGYQGSKLDTLDNLQSEIYFKPLESTDESIEQLAKRMFHFVNTIEQEHADKRIIAFSHGDPIMALKTVITYNSYDFTLFKTDHYIQHGEVFELTTENNTRKIHSVFKPHA